MRRRYLDFADASSYGDIQGGVLTNPPERELDVVFTFTWGETYSVAYSAYATTFLQTKGVSPSSGSISSSFGNTFRWGGLTVTDLDGNPITDFQALDSNGKDWSKPLSVPEPGNASMALFGIAMFGFTAAESKGYRRGQPVIRGSEIRYTIGHDWYSQRDRIRTSPG